MACSNSMQSLLNGVHPQSEKRLIDVLAYFPKESLIPYGEEEVLNLSAKYTSSLLCVLVGNVRSIFILRVSRISS